jgi:hypothetical protein
MDFAELQDQVKFILNWNDGQTNQDFSTARIQAALNRAYKQETIKAEEEGGQRFFKATIDLPWKAGTITFVLPPEIMEEALIAIDDVTTASIGTPLVFSDDGISGDLFWKDHQTLQYGNTGPASDKILRFKYYASVEELQNDGDTPMLIPAKFHELIVWSACIFLQEISGQDVTRTWVAERDELRIDFWKWLSRGRATDDVPTIKNIKTNIDGGLIY